jgi:hypothetical protein
MLENYVSYVNEKAGVVVVVAKYQVRVDSGLMVGDRYELKQRLLQTRLSAAKGCTCWKTQMLA